MSPATAKVDLEVCAGCGDPARAHPMVAVRQRDGGFVADPLCGACWRDPSHRTTSLKAHFFDRRDSAAALARAGSSSLGG